MSSVEQCSLLFAQFRHRFLLPNECTTRDAAPTATGRMHLAYSQGSISLKVRAFAGAYRNHGQICICESAPRAGTSTRTWA